MNIISFSLWGDKPTYCIGAIKNAQLAQILYPGWISRYYCAESVPQNIIKSLKRYKNVEIIKCDGPGHWGNSSDRFKCFDQEDTTIITRDCDSRLSIREVAAVNEWIREGTACHIIRDHPFHNTPVLAGAFGIKGGVIKDLASHMKRPKNHYGYDQELLREFVLPKVMSRTVHDEFFQKKKFPTERVGLEFIGERYDDKDVPYPRDRRALFMYLGLNR
jgi:hypothetical protein